jgi:mono/diheme cytochrome c family protein
MNTALCLAAALTALPASAPSASETSVQRGRELAEARCSSCHAVGATGESPNPASPPFRSLGRRYPLANLEEAFAEGAYVGHAEMPSFTFDALQVSDLVDYLNALNRPAKAKPRQP